MEINHNAPLHSEITGLIEAPVERVWFLLSNIGNWPQWQPDVTQVKLDSEISEKTSFTWKAMGMKIHSIIREFEPESKIGWSGVSLGMQAIHLWQLEPSGEFTFVNTQESLSGWMPKLIKLFDPQFLEKSLTKSLSVLKHESEKPEKI